VIYIYNSHLPITFTYITAAKCRADADEIKFGYHFYKKNSHEVSFITVLLINIKLFFAYG